MDDKIIISQSNALALAKPSTQELMNVLAKASDLELSVYESDMTLSKAMEGTSLKKLGTMIEKINVTKTIVFLTTRLASNFNVGKKFTDEQAVMMAVDLIDIFAHETIEDVLLMFKFARTGRIGDGKEFKLDSQTVFHKWVPQYLELKAEARERIHNRQKDQFTALPKWEKEDTAKFIVSGKEETLTTTPNGLGKRMKEKFDTPGRTTPIVDRRVYIKALAYEATKHTNKNLKNALAFFMEKKEQDAMDVITQELQSRIKH